MSKVFRRERKYFVLKLEDIDKYLSPQAKISLGAISQEIHSCRTQEGKKENSYVVVNNDEAYSGIVWKLIELGVRFLEASND